MGTRGPVPLPNSRRADQRQREWEAMPALPRPEPPPWLGDVDAWDVFWRSDSARIVTEEMVPTVERLFYLRQLYAEWQAPGHIQTSRDLDSVIKLSGTLRALENELGLTPLSRRRMGARPASRGAQELTNLLKDEGGENQ